MESASAVNLPKERVVRGITGGLRPRMRVEILAVRSEPLELGGSDDGAGDAPAASVARLHDAGDHLTTELHHPPPGEEIVRFAVARCLSVILVDPRIRFLTALFVVLLLRRIPHVRALLRLLRSTALTALATHHGT